MITRLLHRESAYLCITVATCVIMSCGATHSYAQSQPKDLARDSYGGWIVSSSVANLDTLYSSNLNDNDPESLWQSAGLGNEEFIEVAWDVLHQVNTVTLTNLLVIADGSPVTITAILEARIKDAWQATSAQPIYTAANGTNITFQCTTVTTNRMRVVLQADQTAVFSASEVHVYGPDQPIVLLRNIDHRWQYEYHSHSTSASGPDPAPPFNMTVLDVQSTPQPVVPGQDAQITLHVRADTQLPYNGAAILTIGKRELYFDRADFSIVRTTVLPGERPSSWPVGQVKTISVPVHIPAYAPHGHIPIMLHVARPRNSTALTLFDQQGQEYTDNIIGQITVERFEGGLIPDPVQHQATIDASLGSPAIAIDGKRIEPVLAAIQTTSYKRLHYYTQHAGIRFYHLQIYPFRIYSGDYQQRNFDYVGDNVEALWRIDPTAWVIIQMDLRTSADWQDANPDGCLYTWDGRRMHESFTSTEYRNEVQDYLTNLVAYVQSQPWGNRVIGYLCELGEPEGTLSGEPDVGDYNPQAIEAFRDFVRSRYDNDLATLRSAYNDPSITFETVYPHHDQIVANGDNGGVFLNPATQKMVIDYHEFVALMVPTFLRDVCAATIKQLTNNRVLVGSYWAYMTHDLTYGGAGYAHQKTHSYLPYIINSDKLDFFSCPFSYDLRRGGDPYRLFQTYDAVRVAGKLSIAEMDNRTYRSGALTNYRLQSVQESLGVMRMNMAKGIMQGLGHWLADWTNNDSDDRRMAESAFADDIQIAEAADMRQLYADTLDMSRTDSAEVAVLLSGPSYFYHDNNASPFYGESIRTMLYSQMTYTGVPYDELLLEDIERTSVQDQYTCYLFINAFRLTAAQQQAIESIKSSGRTVVFMYAPGYVDGNQLSLANLQNLTGMTVNIHHNRRSLMAYTIDNTQHPITSGVINTGPYEGSWGGMWPYFTIPDQAGVTILGRYIEDNAGALAVRNDAPNVVYCAGSYMPADLLRGIFRHAGCHVYTSAPIYMDASDNFLMLTNDLAGTRTIAVTLPRARKVVDTATGEVISDGVARFTVTLRPAQTLFCRLYEPLPAETLLEDNFDIPGGVSQPNLNDQTTNPDRQSGTLAPQNWQSYYDGPDGGRYVYINNHQLYFWGGGGDPPSTNRAMLMHNFNTYDDVTFSVDVRDMSPQGHERYASLVLGPQWAVPSPDRPTMQYADGQGIVYCYPGDGTTGLQASVSPNTTQNLKIRLYTRDEQRLVDMFVNDMQIGVSGLDAGTNLDEVYCTLAGDMPTTYFGTQIFDNLRICRVVRPATCAEVIAQGYGLEHDFNNDCYVNLLDYAILARDYFTCIDPADSTCTHAW